MSHFKPFLYVLIFKIQSKNNRSYQSVLIYTTILNRVRVCCPNFLINYVCFILGYYLTRVPLLVYSSRFVNYLLCSLLAIINTLPIALFPIILMNTFDHQNHQSRTTSSALIDGGAVAHRNH